MIAETKWLEDKRLDSIDRKKLSFLQSILFDFKKQKPEQRLPFLMAFASSNAFKNLSFSKEENAILMEVLKDYADQEDLQKTLRFINMFQQ